MFDLTTVSCPECGDPAEDMPPDHYDGPGGLPSYRHMSDRTALCTATTLAGVLPADPIEDVDGAEVGRGRGGCVMATDTRTRRTGTRTKTSPGCQRRLMLFS